MERMPHSYKELTSLLARADDNIMARAGEYLREKIFGTASHVLHVFCVNNTIPSRQSNILLIESVRARQLPQSRPASP